MVENISCSCLSKTAQEFLFAPQGLPTGTEQYQQAKIFTKFLAHHATRLKSRRSLLLTMPAVTYSFVTLFVKVTEDFLFVTRLFENPKNKITTTQNSSGIKKYSRKTYQTRTATGVVFFVHRKPQSSHPISHGTLILRLLLTSN